MHRLVAKGVIHSTGDQRDPLTLLGWGVWALIWRRAPRSSSARSTIERDWRPRLAGNVTRRRVLHPPIGGPPYRPVHIRPSIAGNRRIGNWSCVPTRYNGMFALASFLSPTAPNPANVVISTSRNQFSSQVTAISCISGRFGVFER